MSAVGTGRVARLRHSISEWWIRQKKKFNDDNPSHDSNGVNNDDYKDRTVPHNIRPQMPQDPPQNMQEILQCDSEKNAGKTLIGVCGWSKTGKSKLINALLGSDGTLLTDAEKAKESIDDDNTVALPARYEWANTGIVFYELPPYDDVDNIKDYYSDMAMSAFRKILLVTEAKIKPRKMDILLWGLAKVNKIECLLVCSKCDEILKGNTDTASTEALRCGVKDKFDERFNEFNYKVQWNKVLVRKIFFVDAYSFDSTARPLDETELLDRLQIIGSE